MLQEEHRRLAKSSNIYWSNLMLIGKKEEKKCHQCHKNI
jgi:hypothetical protein